MIILSSLWQERLTQLASWLAVCFPLAYAAGVAPGDIVASLVSVLFLVHSFAGEGDRSWFKSPWIRAALLLWGYLILRSFFAEMPLDALRKSLPWIRFPVFTAALAFWLLPQEPVRRKLWQVTAAVFVFLLIDGGVQYLTGQSLTGNVPPVEDRLTGPFSAPRLGMALFWIMPVVAFPLLLAHPFSAWRKRWEGWAGLLALMVGFAMILLSGDRGPFLLTLLLLGVAFLILPSLRGLLLKGGLAAALLGGLLIATNPTVLDRQFHATLETIRHVEDSPYGRIWQRALHMIPHHPLFGVAPRHFRHACQDEEKYGPLSGDAVQFGVHDASGQDYYKCNRHTHNTFLEMLVEGGAVGLALYLAVLGLLAREAVRHYPQWKANPAAIAPHLVLIGWFWPLISTSSLFSSWYILPFWLAAGWALSYHRKGESGV